ncbi:NADP-dependent oxidoreductase [Actinocrinis puniceicyclus]|nr:NADP-dependent oxidoreductase [Actinocrinis puniceicyclus]
MTRAIVFDEYGGPQVLRLVDLPDPVPGPGQVRIRVRAAGVQPADSKLRSGAWKSWAPVTFPGRLGNEAAGVVDALGPEVTGFAVGDEVLGPANGAYADTVVASVKLLAPKPAALTWSEAGALAASGQTASTVLEDLAVKPGETILVNAAAGGVGLMAVQIAVARGVKVIGTASEANHEFLRGLGVVPVTYGPGLADRVRAAAPEGVDAALDAAGGDALEVSLDLVGDRDRVGTIVDQGAAARLAVKALGTRRSGSRLAELVALAAAGELRVFVWKQFPLERAADAHRESEGRHVRGKIVLMP